MVIVGGAIVLGSIMSLIGLLIQILHTLRPAAPGTLLYGIYRTGDGRLVEMRPSAALLPDGTDEAEAEPVMPVLERSR